MKYFKLPQKQHKVILGEMPEHFIKYEWPVDQRDATETTFKRLIDYFETNSVGRVAIVQTLVHRDLDDMNSSPYVYAIGFEESVDLTTFILSADSLKS